MISRSRLWSNFLHWPTNQLLSFHNFHKKIIASCCSHSYPQGWRNFTVLLSVTFDFAPKEATQSAYKPSISVQRSPLQEGVEGRPRPTINMVVIISSATLSGRGTLKGSSEPQRLVWLIGTPGDDVSPVASWEGWNVSADDVLYYGI